MADSLEDYTPEQIAQMASTYQAILNDPATREIGLRVTKKVNPKLSIPEIDLKDATHGALKERDSKIEALENQMRERDARDRIERERQALRSDGLTQDDVDAIEKIMMDEHIPSYQTAAKYYKAQRQVSVPTPETYRGSGAGSYSLPEDPMKALKGGKNALRSYALNSASEALNDLRSGRIKLH